MQKKLLLLSFIEGAAVMAAELCGARLLAPIFGSSLYVWASVMGLTLLALALGYFAGGLFSARFEQLRANLRKILSVSGTIMVLMPVAAFYLVPRISYLPFLPGMILSAMLLLIPPIFLLGASSPLFIRMQAQTVEEAGRVSGLVYAVSTVGGILATFLCGFIFIPVFGLQVTLIIFGLVLFFGSNIFLRGFAVLEILLIALALYLNFQIIKNKQEMLLHSDSVMGRLEIKDVHRKNSDVRTLAINDIIQSEMNLATHKSVSPYLILLDTVLPTAPKCSKALVLGLGGGLSAQVLLSKGYAVTGIEFDDRIAKAAQDYFFLNPEVQVLGEDARYFMNHCVGKYDLVLADLFRAEEQPSHVFTIESLKALKNNLNANAKLYISWHGYLEGEKGKGTHILLNTLKAAGYKCRVISNSEDEDSRNLIIIASLQELPRQFGEQDIAAIESSEINTDDAPKLELANAAANKAWRSLYLKYYQQE